MTKLKAGLLSAVVVAGVGTPLVVRHEAKLRQENRSLRQQLDQAAQLTAENERLSNLVAQETSSRALATSQLNELLRLRSEVGNLRRQTNELDKLHSENQRLRSSQATASARPKTAPQAATSQDNVPKEAWAFAGYANPESAFQSTVWAMSQGDAKTFRASLAPGGDEFRDAEGKSESELATKAKAEFEKVTGFRIIEKEMVSEEEAILTVMAGGINEVGRFKLQRVGGDWKLDGPVKDRGQSSK